MAVKYNRTDDLDKMFEEFATLPKLEKVSFQIYLLVFYRLALSFSPSSSRPYLLF